MKLPYIEPKNVSYPISPDRLLISAEGMVLPPPAAPPGVLPLRNWSQIKGACGSKESPFPARLALPDQHSKPGRSVGAWVRKVPPSFPLTHVLAERKTMGLGYPHSKKTGGGRDPLGRAHRLARASPKPAQRPHKDSQSPRRYYYT